MFSCFLLHLLKTGGQPKSVQHQGAASWTHGGKSLHGFHSKKTSNRRRKHRVQVKVLFITAPTLYNSLCSSFPGCKERPGRGEIARARHLGIRHRFSLNKGFLSLTKTLKKTFLCFRLVESALTYPSLVTKAQSNGLFQQVLNANYFRESLLFV